MCGSGRLGSNCHVCTKCAPNTRRNRVRFRAKLSETYARVHLQWRDQNAESEIRGLQGSADPYFNLIRVALGDLVAGEHFFDIIGDDVIYEVLYVIAGWPQTIRGRADLMAQFRGYCDNVELQSADKLITHKTDDGYTVVIEYEVHGTILRTRVKYD